MLRIQEVTHDENAEVVFDLACFDYTNKSTGYRGTAGYRSHRIADLYGHLPKPVEDLALLRQEDQAWLQFSADPTRTYVAETSTNLVDWTELGTPVDNGDGNFIFESETLTGPSSTFYRIATH